MVPPTGSMHPLAVAAQVPYRDPQWLLLAHSIDAASQAKTRAPVSTEKPCRTVHVYSDKVHRRARSVDGDDANGRERAENVGFEQIFAVVR